MMFVSHRMDEIYRIADRVAVLRDGRLVAITLVDRMPHDRAVQLMVGRPLSAMFPVLIAVAGDIVLEVQGLTRAGVFEEVSFTLRAGEILGFGGLVGSGRTESRVFCSELINPREGPFACGSDGFVEVAG